MFHVESAYDSRGKTEPTTTLVFPPFDCFSFVISFVNAIHGSPPLLDPDNFRAHPAIDFN
jgi:hypothetical protein